jgi:hypothetical protein
VIWPPQSAEPGSSFDRAPISGAITVLQEDPDSDTRYRFIHL